MYASTAELLTLLAWGFDCACWLTAAGTITRYYGLNIYIGSILCLYCPSSQVEVPSLWVQQARWKV